MFNIGATDKRYAYMRRTVLAPIDDLRLTLEFPPGYPITLPSSGGFNVYRSSAEDHVEKTRLAAANSFSVNFDKARDQWVLQLNVGNARLGCSYEIQWIPPRKSKITM